MVVVPPLLADIVRHGLCSRIADVTITDLADLQHAPARLRDTDADVVIVGPSAPTADATLIRKILPYARVLTVSPNLSQLVDFDSGARVEFTLDALVECLRR
jgi:hypothetical protein